jgi:hypothetical protein
MLRLEEYGLFIALNYKRFQVVSGQDVVTRIEQLKVGAKSRPICDVVVSACGQLIKKKADSTDGEEEV